ncbi:MAG: ATP-binding protein, partial [Candidatus Woesearchaeota archaeon]
PETYEGNLVFTTNNDPSLTQTIPTKITIAHDQGYIITQSMTSLEAATDTDTSFPPLQIENTGNSPSHINVLSENLKSTSDFVVEPGRTTIYTPIIRTRNSLGEYVVNISVNDEIIEYVVNVINNAQISHISPSTLIVENDTIKLHVNNNNMSIIDSGRNLRVSIHGIDCPIDESSSDLEIGYSEILCIAPAMIEDLEYYEIVVSFYIDDVYIQARGNITYLDIIPPSVNVVDRDVNYQNESIILFNVTDRSGVDSVIVHIMKDSTILDSIGTQDSRLNMTDDTYLLSYTFEESSNYYLRVTAIDELQNEGHTDILVSHYPTRSFVPESFVSRGKGSSIFSSVYRQTGGSPVSAIIRLKDPETQYVLYEQMIHSTDGTFPLNELQERDYDIEVVSDFSYNYEGTQREGGLIVNLREVVYNGSELLTLEKLEFSDVTKLFGFAFSSPQDNLGTISFLAPKITGRTNYYITRCSDWDYYANVCIGEEQDITPESSVYSDKYFRFDIDIDGFSSYILRIPPMSVGGTPVTDTVTVPGGGGGGGISPEQLEDLIRIGNVTHVSSTSDEIQIDTRVIERTLEPGETRYVTLTFVNAANRTRYLEFYTDERLLDIISIEPRSVELTAGSSVDVLLTIIAPEAHESLTINGFVYARVGDEILTVPVALKIEDRSELPRMQASIITPRLPLDGTVQFQVTYAYTYAPRSTSTLFEIDIEHTDSSNIMLSDSLRLNVTESFDRVFLYNLTGLDTGRYSIRIKAVFSDPNGRERVLTSFVNFEITQNILYRNVAVIGNRQILVWHIIVLLLTTIFFVYAFIRIRKEIQKRKRYQLPVDVRLLPQSDKRGYIGYVAETNIRTFIDLHALKMHTLVAGSTGGGKSFAGQVIVEEALMKNVAVVVFDPTAQWSGFLRKQTNNTILKLYKKFGLDPGKDPRAFKGNIRRVENPLEILELKDYLKPGEITIIDCHKMTFEQIDYFVANTVSQVFMSELEESPDLKLLMVYDEVHRLLPKFGGSGAGFMQVERACREFRKWGIGMLLISQVLSDFIGQIKANINTEVQMRTRDEEDLKRLSLKYGEDLLRAVIKADVGTGMIQNSAYNRGRPYMVSFRPLYHAVERLTEVELKEYDKYNAKLLDYRDSMMQLESNGVDIMDLQVEIELTYDKMKEGKFDVVEIYVEELERKLKNMWDKIGKKPTSRKIKLLDEKMMEKYVELAKKQHYESEKKGETYNENPRVDDDTNKEEDTPNTNDKGGKENPPNNTGDKSQDEKTKKDDNDAPKKGESQNNKGKKNALDNLRDMLGDE